MKTKSSLLLIGCLCATTAAHAQGTLVVSPSSMGDIQNNWPDYGDSQSITFPTPTTPLANYTAVQVRFSAPSGYAWQITPSRDQWTLNCSIAYSAPGTDDYPSADFSFNFVPGMSSSVSGGIVDQRLSESSFGFDAAFQFGGGVEFTDLIITLNYVSLHAWQIAQRPMAPFDQSLMKLTYLNAPDPDQHLLLVTVPEPNFAGFAIVGLGAGLATVRFAGRKLT